MITLALLTGLWTTTCIQTQIQGTSTTQQGYLIESYRIESDGDYRHTQEWFTDSTCTKIKNTVRESGKLALGKEIKGDLFNPKIIEVDYKSEGGKTDLGAIAISANESDEALKIARGTKESVARNTMVSLFEYKKSK